MSDRTFQVYILTNTRKTVLYTGVTGNLEKRIQQHKTGKPRGFTSRYNVDRLVFFEEYERPDEAIMREKQIKAGSRQKKIDLINSLNPEWKDLSEDWE